MTRVLQVIEPHSKTIEHYRFNAGILQSLERLNIEYVFHGEQQHCAIINVASKLSCEKLIYLASYKKPYLSKALSLLRVLDIMRLTRKGRVLVLSSTTFMNFLLLIVCFIIKEEVFVFLHSEISNQKPRSLSWKLRSILLFRSKNLHFIVNAKFIKDRLEAIDKKFNLVCVPHPIFISPTEANKNYTKLGYCSVGAYSVNKNSDMILKLKELLGAKEQVGHIGQYFSSQFSRDELDCLAPMPKLEPLDHVNYESQLQRVTGILMFPSNDFHYYAVSGVIFDAVSERKKIYTTQNQTMRAIQHSFPSLIEVCDSVETMAKYILKGQSDCSAIAFDSAKWNQEVDSALESMLQARSK